MTAFAPIKVWRIQDAPDEFKRFCPAGWLNLDGKSNIEAVWLAVVPANFGWVGWLEGKGFNCCESFEHPLEGGGYIAVSGHHSWCSTQGACDLPVDTNRAIRVWRYGDESADIPVPYTDDADWVAQVPRDLVATTIAWMEPGQYFGNSEPDVHELPDGSELRIGCHA